MSHTKKIYDYVIFHKNCIDGFTGFFILNNTHTIKKNAFIFADVPSAKTPPLNLTDKNVIIIDVAYKYEVLKQIMSVAHKVTFIDHHITIKDDVLKIIDELQNKNHEVIYDEFMSGASLVWKYFYPNKKMPLFIKYVEDNDIGAWKLKHTIDFISGLETNYNFDLTHNNISHWYNLYNINEINNIIKKGHIYNEYKQFLTNNNAKRYSLELFPSTKIYEKFPSFFKKPGQFIVAVYCGSGCPNTTTLGKKILDSVNCDFVIMWSLNLDKKDYVLAFRSISVDVGIIASIFDGGGHKLAAACSFNMNKYNIQDLFFPSSLPRSSK